MKRGAGVRSGHDRAIWTALAVLMSAHLVWQIWLVTAAPYPLRYDYDEGVYAETAAAAARGAPLYSSVFLSQPPLLAAVLTRAFAIFGASLVVARTVIVTFSLLWLGSIAAIAAAAAGPRAGASAAAIAASAAAFAGAAHTVQMEGPSEALAALAVALALAARRGSRADRARPRPGGILWTAVGAAEGLALMTKLTALSCVVPLGIALASGRRAAGCGRSRAAAATGAVAAITATILWTNSPPAQFWSQAVAFHAAAARVFPFDPARTAALMLQFALSNWLLVAAGFAGGIVCAASPEGAAGRAIIAWLAADVIGLFVVRPVWPHHLEILVSPLAVLAGTAVDRLLRRGPKIAGPAAVIVAIWVVAALTTVVANRPAASPQLTAAVMRVRRAVRRDAWIVTDDPAFALLAGREVPPALTDTSEVRMEAGWLTDQTLTAAIHDPRVRAVVLWRGTFQRMRPAFVEEAMRRFPTRWNVDADRTILLR